MTSPLATNFVGTAQRQPRYLEVDVNGLPLQRQVGKTVEYYTGAGGVSVVPSGTDVLYVNSTLATGALTLDLTSTANYTNMIGRSMLVYLSPAAGNNLIVDITGGGRAFRLTGDTGDQATITAGGFAQLHFIDSLNCLITANALCTTA